MTLTELYSQKDDLLNSYKNSNKNDNDFFIDSIFELDSKINDLIKYINILSNDIIEIKSQINNE